MNSGPTATATIELSLGTDAPWGVLTDGRGQSHSFTGWIELAAAIEDWRTSATAASSLASATERPDSRPTGPARPH